jgi:hypothetical protein
MTGDCVQQLGARVGLDAAAPFLDHAQPEVDVPEHAAFIGLPESRPCSQLRDATDVVEESSGDQQIAT